MANPKYVFPITLDQSITFHHDNDYFGFSIKYRGRQKIFRAHATKLREFKALLDAKILYGDMLSYYRPLQQLGEGAYSTVAMVQNVLSKQIVAAKYLNRNWDGKSQNERFQEIKNEVRILGKLTHPNIVKIKEIYEQGNSIVIIHEYVDGVTLEQFIEQKGLFLMQPDIQNIMRQILVALMYIHEQGLVHRDIKPENIMIDKAHNIKLIDFGFAAQKGSPLSLIRCGTPGYIAPEIIHQKSPKHVPFNKCDVFSLGAVFYKLVTLEDLFAGDQFKTVIQKNKEFDIDLRKVINSSLPDQGINLLTRMLDVNTCTRISAKEALGHPYFKECLRPAAKKPTLQIQTISHLPNSVEERTQVIRKFSQTNGEMASTIQFYSPRNKMESTARLSQFDSPKTQKQLTQTLLRTGSKKGEVSTQKKRTDFNF